MCEPKVPEVRWVDGELRCFRDGVDVSDEPCPDEWQPKPEQFEAISIAEALDGKVIVGARLHDIDKPCQVIDIDADEDWGLPMHYQPKHGDDPNA